ncbi:hypothetical protein E6W39_00220 [Kitasatospora acidiphila]|uniref:Uncharacterized protein n=1 Tax=Kitasatospora acidiphila TaxID=2567942 RepID=A0A540WGA8_9ACTN|nr:hypothetical protein [Kitasatospora acidiphila]TQF08022.1 hypothetical protein E6W39_00220 [Kitasatospora acidiphila]
MELFKALQRLITRELKSPARPLDDEALTRQAKELIRHLTDRLATLDAAEVIAAARAGQRSQLYRPGRLGLVPLAEELAGAEEPVDDTLAPAVPGTPVSVLPR